MPGGMLVQSPAQKWCPHVKGPKALVAPRQVCYSLGVGRVGMASMGLIMGQGFARGLVAPEMRRAQIPAQKKCPRVGAPKGPRGPQTGVL